jgi:UDP-N-acetylglucosamine 1-carboxyvinyltransferase
VVELGEMLTAMGAFVEGKGTTTLRVIGTPSLKGVTHTLRGDYIEAASWGIVVAVTGGDVIVKGAKALDMEPTVTVLKEMGLDCDLKDDEFVVRPSSLRAVRRIVTGLWPAFPSDIVSLVTVLATQAEGRTLLHDWMYELRLFALEQLSAMGADLFLCDSHRIIVTGKTRLRGRALDSRDIRSGMALIAASLVAQGDGKILEVETVERGYADLVNRLTALGADVERRE